MAHRGRRHVCAEPLGARRFLEAEPSDTDTAHRLVRPKERINELEKIDKEEDEEAEDSREENASPITPREEDRERALSRNGGEE